MRKEWKKLASLLTLTAALAVQTPVPLAAETGGSGAISTAVTILSESDLKTIAEEYENAVVISLSDEEISVDESTASTDKTAAVYTANDIIYYEDRDTYDDGYTYGEGTDADKHTAEEAAANTVIHITQPGTYVLSGTLSAGQIFVDLGEDAETDPEAVVTLVFAGADITCEVAPAVLFYRVFECDTAWTAYDNGDAENYTASSVQDTAAAGANVIVADGTVNNVNGSYVAKIYKDNADLKKKYKFDGAFYSRMTLNMDGESEGTGVINITAENEGLDTEMHLSINGGIINIYSQDDGINTNEDNVSVTTINGGSLHIVAGLGEEGDGIDSNGYLVINGGIVIATANPAADAGLDSDLGSYVNGGYVVATGSTMDWAESESKQVTMNLQFASMQNADEAVIVTDTDGKVIFAYDPDKDETTGSDNRSYQGMILSCPEFAVGNTYHVYVGGTIEGSEVNGLYDADSVTGFSGAVQQEYTGTDVGVIFGGQNGDGQTPPEGDTGGQNGEMPTPPEGDPGGQNGEMPTPPEGDPGGQNGEMPTPPEGDPGGQNGEMPTPPEGDMGGQNGITAGTASTEFYMTDKVNAFSGVTDIGTSPAASGFTDVLADSYYAEAVSWAVANSVTNGTSATTFSPAIECTRAQMVTFLYRAAGSPEVTSSNNPFTDVDEDSYYYNAVLWAVEQGITKGTTETTFAPDAQVTRGQAVTFLYRLNGSQDVAAENPFTDVAETSFCYDAVLWAVEQGITNGMTETTFEPGTACQRAHIVTFLYRYFG